MPSTTSTSVALSLLAASAAFAAPTWKRQSTIPADGGFTFGCSTRGTGVSIVLPGDGSATTSGFDATNNCGEGVLDNLHGQGLVIDDFACTYVGTSTAEINFVCNVYEAPQIVAAINAATGQQMPDNTCTTGLLNEPSSKKLKRGGPLPTDGGLNFSCTSEGETGFDQYTVVLPGDGTTTTAGFDAPGNCGEGVLDNMNGQGLAPTSFGCNYVGSNTANITFALPIGEDAQVAAAINAATGSEEALCNANTSPEGAAPEISGDDPIATGP